MRLPARLEYWIKQKAKAGVWQMDQVLQLKAPPFRPWRYRPPAVVYWLRKNETQPDQQEQKVA